MLLDFAFDDAISTEFEGFLSNTPPYDAIFQRLSPQCVRELEL